MSQRIAIYDVNDYILNTIPTLFDYTTGKTKPILPIQDVPETGSFTGPYMTYSVRTYPQTDSWWLSSDDVNYMIWDYDLDKIQPIVVQLTDMFRRMDESATEINEYLEAIPRNDFSFHSFRVVETMFPAPVSSEADRYGQPFNIRYVYNLNSGKGIN